MKGAAQQNHPGIMSWQAHISAFVWRNQVFEIAIFQKL